MPIQVERRARRGTASVSKYVGYERSTAVLPEERLEGIHETYKREYNSFTSGTAKSRQKPDTIRL